MQRRLGAGLARTQRRKPHLPYASRRSGERCRPFFRAPGDWNKFGVTAANLGGEFFLTTGSGKFFRNIALDPEHSIGIVELNPAGDAWRIVWGLEGGAKPTSEFPSHILNHSVRKAATGGENRVIYHAHPANRIVLNTVSYHGKGAAEVTINYVITDVEKKRKFVCVDTHDIPEVAVVDPDMMASMPKGLTAATGMDALTHAIEGYITKATWEMTDMFHLEAVPSSANTCALRWPARPRAARAWRSRSILRGRASQTSGSASCIAWRTAWARCTTRPTAWPMPSGCPP